MPEVGTKRTNNKSAGDEADADVQKKSRQEGDKLRLLVLGRYAGSLIGKGGANFIRLREAYNVKITGLSSRANERVVQLEGQRVHCLGIVREILPLCPVGRYQSSSGQSSFEVNLLANNDDVGILIGKGGSKIKELTGQTDTKLKIYPECLPGSNERVIALGGEDVDVVVQGLETILDLLDQAPNRSTTVYFRPDKLGEQHQLTSNLLGKNANPFGNGGVQDGMVNNIAALLVAQRNTKQQKGFDPSWDFGSVQTTTTLTLSNELCGAIIGKGGLNIRYVKQVSGAVIEMTKSDGDSERTITMTGTQDQITVAEQLMDQCIRSSKRGSLQQLQPQQQHQPQQQMQQMQHQPQQQMQQMQHQPWDY